MRRYSRGENRRSSLIAVAATLLALALAPPAMAKRNLHVDDDRRDCPNAEFQSIQAAVAAAPPGSTILVCKGQYREQVRISTQVKNDLRVMAKGRPGEAVLEGDDHREYGFRLEDVSGVLIDGFLIRRYAEGIQLLRADENTIRFNRTTEQFVHDGIVLRFSDRNVIRHNVSSFNTQLPGCGISLAAESSFNVVRHNVTFGNFSFGLLLAPLPAFPFTPLADIGAISAGIPPGPGNVIRHNVTRDNPGHGIGNVRAPRTRIEHNDVLRNGFRPDRRRGIHVVGPESTGVVVEHNKVFDNASDGIFFNSETSGNLVQHNTSLGNLGFDCRDDTVGPDPPSFTLNVWEHNFGRTENRPGLCRQGAGGGVGAPGAPPADGGPGHP